MDSQLNKQVQDIVDSIPAATFIKDAGGRIVYMNHACEEQWGITFDVLGGTDGSQFFPPEQIERFREKDREVIAGGKQIEYEAPFWNAKLKENRIGFFIKNPTFDAEGKLLFLVCITFDVTEDKKAAAALRLQSQIVENAVEGIVLIKASDSTIQYTNRQFETLFGYAPGELIGKHISIINAPGNKSQMETAQEINRQLEKEGVWSGEVFNRRKDGTTINTFLNASSFQHPELGDLWIGYQRDITKRKLTEAVMLEKESQYRAAIDTAADGFWLVDMQGRLLEVNDAYARLSGYSREELIGMSIPELDAIDNSELVRARIEEIIRNGGYLEFDTMHKRKDGSLWPVHISTTYSSVSGGRCFVFSTDLTEQKRAEESLRLAAMVYENSSEAILVTDADNLIIAVNPAFEQMTGYAAAEVLGKNPRIFKSGRHDRAFYHSMWLALDTEGYWHGEVWDKRKNGEEYIKLLTINVIRDDDGAIYRHVALFTDITERKKVEELIWRQANYDSLTKLPNRQMFHDRLEQEAKKAHRAGLSMALLLIDLDRFKEVNDTLGHDKGDILLIEAARRISACVRESDTVARLGGDEFIVILSELEDMASIDRVAQDILGSLAEPFKLDAEPAYISASIGISLYPNDATELDVLFKHADQAMYVAKYAGRNRFNYFTKDMQEAAQARMHLANDLRIAVAAGQFRVYYQPIVEMSSGQIYKAEALIRWQHPVRGMVSPAEFIPLAEETGLIVPIGEWVFRQAVQQVVQWRRKFHRSFQISVNKSPVQFRHAESLSWPEYLEQQHVSGDSIIVEITEGLLLDAEVEVNKKLLRFRDAGIQVAIDDFGTGYSSLSYLKEFDIDYLKIDQSFVRNLGPGTSDLALCEAIIVMAHKLGFKVIAEGVETSTQHELLAAAGCDYGQGYLYSRPLPPEEFERQLAGKL
ncbi:PAS domain S-box protein [Sideroxydans lithotrophicus]|uniref:Diguanylate cyclase/phosphodiesterase with PAS/PAC sensor(S) n=1 Tax=Sideroxydans lithotrophicus (strain ES-1) TaxID=580332 RepID=D5CPV3_SIDLE|nr:PAS domain S-box protein [Sideroxydans lithotrophicus]ADE11117.1 diguanylate cyclase/phosphodiesterase with PAS/PAC sensor(s) [Sideroxydans lithotrophicus ES-1]